MRRARPRCCSPSPPALAAQWPHVKNPVAHHSLYDHGRMQEVRLDR